MLAAQFVQPGQDRCGGQRLAVDGHRIAAREPDFHHFRFVGRSFRVDRPLPDVIRRLLPRIFQHFPFGTGVQQVCVHRKRGFTAFVFRNRNLVRLGKFQKRGAAGQAPFAPGRDHADSRIQCKRRQFKSDLIVTLARRPMCHRIRTGFRRNPHQMLRNQGARDGRAQQIQAFVQCIRPEHREHEIPHEFFTHIDDVNVFRLDPQQDRLGPCGFQFLALTQIGGEGDHLTPVFGLQPFQDDRRIKTARIGENNFFRCGHVCLHRRVARDYRETGGRASGAVDRAGSV